MKKEAMAILRNTGNRWRAPVGPAILLAAVVWIGCGPAAVTSAQVAGKSGQASSRRAIAFYADAASFQNNGAYELAIDEWKKLLKEFPNDPLASKAWHYLGICYTRIQPADLEGAIEAFTNSLKDQKLDVREESLIHLSWSQFTRARSEQAGSAEQKQGFEQAKSSLTTFLSSYGSSSFSDQALFYLGEIEYSLGDTKRSIAYYNKLLTDKRFEDSKLLTDARYALAVAYEEEDRASQAAKQYKLFLESNPDHRLASEVRVRLADIYLKDNQAAEAEELLTSLASSSSAKASDYALLRLAYALSQQKKNTQAAKYYKQLLSQYPDSDHAGTAALSLGQLLHLEGDFDAAIQEFNRIVAKQDDQAAEAVHWIATTLLKQGKSQEAEALLSDALKWSGDAPNATSLKMDYADALYNQPTKLEKAQRAYERIARDTPKDPLAPRAAYNVAFAALQGGRLPEARQWAEFFLSRYPQDPLRNDVAYVAAETLLQQGEHEAAAQAYASLRSTATDNPSLDLWALRQAMALYLDGQYEQAIGLLEKENKRFKQSAQLAESEFITGASLLYLEKLPEAIKQLQASHQTDAKWASADEVLLMLAEAQQRSKDNAAARKTLETLLKEYPSTRLKQQVTYKLAQLSAALQDYDQAITGYRQVSQDPQAEGFHRFARYGIAWALMQQEDYAQALRELTPLLADNSNDSIQAEALLAQGVCLRKTGQTAQAIDALKSFLKTSPQGNTLGNGLYELGLAHTEQNDLKAATENLERILDEVPGYPAIDKVLYELAWNAQEDQQATKANQYFQRLTQEFPGSEFSPEATYMLAQQKYEAGKYSQAAKDYEQVLTGTSDPELTEKTLYKLGWSYFQQDKFESAAAVFERQSSQYSGGKLAVDALFMKAECDFNQDRFEEALAGYTAARTHLESGKPTAASDQVRALIYLHGGQCYREQKDWQQSQRWYQLVLKNFPDSPYRDTAEYELGYCKQNLNETAEALKIYDRVADNNRRSEIGARARFMSGEVYFSQRDFVAAIREFQRVMYGFGAAEAPEAIKNWQAKAAFEAARCSEVLADDRQGSDRDIILSKAQEYYDFIVKQHASHTLARQAQTRLGELQNLR